MKTSNISSEVNSNFESESEWVTFLSKIRAWLGTKGSLTRKDDLLVNPSLLAIGFLVLLISLKAYTTILSNLEKIPFATGVFEVIGTFWLIKFSITRLLRNQDRQQFFSEVKNRWETFLG